MTTPEIRPVGKSPQRTRGKPTNVDIHVGQRVRQRRTLLGITQEALADKLGMTFQQVQKYEYGTNRIGAGRLYQLSQVLQMPVSYFFEGLDRKERAREASSTMGELLASRASRELVHAYFRIPSPAVRRCIRGLIKALADEGAIHAPGTERRSS